MDLTTLCILATVTLLGLALVERLTSDRTSQAAAGNDVEAQEA